MRNEISCNSFSRLKVSIFMIALLMLPFIANAQVMQQEEKDAIFNEIENHRVKVEKARIKRIDSYRVKSKNDSILTHYELFDRSGNLIESMSHRFRNRKHTDTRFYLYDSLNRRIEEYSIISFSPGFISNSIIYAYDSIGKLSTMRSGSAMVGTDIIRGPVWSRLADFDSTVVYKNDKGQVDSLINYSHGELDDMTVYPEKHVFNYRNSGELEMEQFFISGELFEVKLFDVDGNLVARTSSNYRKKNNVNVQTKFIFKDGFLLETRHLRKSGKTKYLHRSSYTFWR